jgi:hypothetical protein
MMKNTSDHIWWCKILKIFADKKFVASAFCVFYFFIFNHNLEASNLIPNSAEVFHGESMFYQDLSQNGIRDITGSQNPQDGLSGAMKVRNILGYAIAFIKRLIVPVAIISIVIAGFVIVTNRNPEQMKKRKDQVIGIVAGLWLMMGSVVLVDEIFFGKTGEIFQGQNEPSVHFAQHAFLQLDGVINFATTFLVGIGVLMLVLASYRLIFGATNEESMSKARSQVIWSIVGIIIVLSAKTFVRLVTPDGRLFGPVSRAPDLMLFLGMGTHWINYIFGFLGIVGVLAIVVSGARMIFYFGDDEQVSKSKQTIIYTVIGLIVAFSAYTIVRYFVLLGN